MARTCSATRFLREGDACCANSPAMRDRNNLENLRNPEGHKLVNRRDKAIDELLCVLLLSAIEPQTLNQWTWVEHLHRSVG